MSKKISTFFLGLGLLFLINAIFGGYIVMPGYLMSLEQAAEVRRDVESGSHPINPLINTFGVRQKSPPLLF